MDDTDISIIIIKLYNYMLPTLRHFICTPFDQIHLSNKIF